MVESKSAVQTTIWLYVQYFLLMPECFLDEGQVMANIFFHDANRLRHFPDRQGTLLQRIDEGLPDGLFSFLDHSMCLCRSLNIDGMPIER